MSQIDPKQSLTADNPSCRHQISDEKCPLRGAFFHFRNQLVDVDAIKVQLKRHDIRISMDGKGAWSDNVFVERLWRSIKYEEIYLKAYDSVCAARCAIAQCPHQAHS